MDIQIDLTPKQQIEGVLATTYLTGVYHNRRARDIILGLLEKCLPGVPVSFAGVPEAWPNPRISARLDAVMAWTVLREVCVRCDLKLGISDDGITLRAMTPSEMLTAELAKQQGEAS